MIEKLSAIDKVSLVGLAKQIEAQENTKMISELAGKFKIPLMNEHRNRKRLIKKITKKTSIEPLPFEETYYKEQLELAKKVISFLLKNGPTVQENGTKPTISPILKEFIVKLQEEGKTYPQIASLLGMELETIKRFKEQGYLETNFLEKKPLSANHEFILSAWNEANNYHRKNLDSFWVYLGRKFSTHEISHEEVRQILIDLGLRYPHGPGIQDHGAQVKKNILSSRDLGR